MLFIPVTRSKLHGLTIEIDEDFAPNSRSTMHVPVWPFVAAHSSGVTCPCEERVKTRIDHLVLFRVAYAARH